MSEAQDPQKLVPMDKWGKDHWSTLAYIETVAVDSGGFQVGFDGRMKTNRHNYRVLSDECPHPKRARPASRGIVMTAEQATKLKDGSLVENHDDWACLQDFCGEGLFQSGQEIEPKTMLNFSDRGQKLSAALRAHKAEGGQFAAFDYTKVELPPIAQAKPVRKRATAPK